MRAAIAPRPIKIAATLKVGSSRHIKIGMINNPTTAPALAQMSLIVETHDVYRRGALEELVRRFAPSHQITVVRQQTKAFDMPPWLQALPHLDQLLAVWEWRRAPTPWPRSG